jgi:hypothetical protein
MTSGVVEQQVAECVIAWFQALRSAIAIRQPPELVAISNSRIEPAIAVGFYHGNVFPGERLSKKTLKPVLLLIPRRLDHWPPR